MNGTVLVASLISSLDEHPGLIDQDPIMVLLRPIHASAKGEEPRSAGAVCAGVLGISCIDHDDGKREDLARHDAIPRLSAASFSTS
jgi:hypothetical protein